ncbi:Gag-like protein [Elysia marginata]|uniref:Gag-like protein n=1 Tax=Elysia marginata TaxID=1093978 RepID=A0AAV4JMG3_9GAST|nr:Gag-like protein [Elysia marginata]
MAPRTKVVLPWRSSPEADYLRPLVGLGGGWGVPGADTYNKYMDKSTSIQPEKRPRVALGGKKGAENVFSPLAPQRIYMDVESVGGESVSDLSPPPFRLHREIMGILGGECNISKTTRGVMLELTRKSDEEKLTKIKELGGIKVKVARDTNLNTSRGVINHRDLRGSREEEFVEWIRARRIEIKRGRRGSRRIHTS